MPQKKNPHALERVKALAGQAIGWLPAMMGCQHTVLSTDLDYAFGDDTLTPMGDACLGSLRLMTEGHLGSHAFALGNPRRPAAVSSLRTISTSRGFLLARVRRSRSRSEQAYVSGVDGDVGFITWSER
jgi:hypothetical protein